MKNILITDMESNQVESQVEYKILRCLKDGDMQAFSLVYNFYWDGLYNFALRLMKEESLAQDVLHDVFTELWARHKRLNIQSSLKDYLFICTKNRCFKLLGKLRRLNEVEEHLLLDIAIEHDELSYKELSDQLDGLLAKLPIKTRAIFIMSREDDLSYKQIAKKMNLSIKSVEYHISKVLNKLRKAL